MGKIDRELCNKRGERVKELLRDHKMRQIELADEIHVTPEHLNAILNGKRTLTLEHARFIARRFSVQLDWVMAFSDFKTANDQLCASLDKMEEHAKTLHSIIRFATNSQGYDIEMVDRTEDKQWIDTGNDPLFYVFKREGQITAHLSLDDYAKLRDEIYHYSCFLVERYRQAREEALIKQKKDGENNG